MKNQKRGGMHLLSHFSSIADNNDNKKLKIGVQKQSFSYL